MARPISENAALVREMLKDYPPGNYTHEKMFADAQAIIGPSFKHPTGDALIARQRAKMPEFRLSRLSGRWVKDLLAADPAPSAEREPAPLFPPKAEDRPEPIPMWPAPPRNTLKEVLETLVTKHGDRFQGEFAGTMIQIDHLTPSLPYLEDAAPEGYRLEVVVERDTTSIRLGYVGPGSA